MTKNFVVKANRVLAKKSNNFKVKIKGMFSSAYLLFFIGADAACLPARQACLPARQVRY